MKVENAVSTLSTWLVKSPSVNGRPRWRHCVRGPRARDATGFQPPRSPCDDRLSDAMRFSRTHGGRARSDHSAACAAQGALRSLAARPTDAQARARVEARTDANRKLLNIRSRGIPCDVVSRAAWYPVRLGTLWASSAFKLSRQQWHRARQHWCTLEVQRAQRQSCGDADKEL